MSLAYSFSHIRGAATIFHTNHCGIGRATATGGLQEDRCPLQRVVLVKQRLVGGASYFDYGSDVR
jgi:hypothetical protein